MFKFNYVAALMERSMRKKDVPLHLELHPGSHCGPLDCIFCFGKTQTFCNGSLTIEDYSTLLDDLMEYCPFIEISGIRSDPLSYPDFPSLIREIKSRNLHFGIHTNAYFLSDEVIKALNETPCEGSYITISINSDSSDVYNKLHSLELNSRVFEELKQKIDDLYQNKTRKDSKLKISLAYLLMTDNSSKEQIKNFIETFQHYANTLQFSIPQIPNVAQPTGYLQSKEILKISKILENWRNGKVTMLNSRNTKHCSTFNYCWAQRFNATIDGAGNVFPCPQVALNDYRNLIWGNIKEKRFWNIWSSAKRLNMQQMLVDDMNCRVCNRKDENINIKFNKMMDKQRDILNTPKNKPTKSTQKQITK
jgi:radical SAM protein with 4Fe4S-binding SPASM domain